MLRTNSLLTSHIAISLFALVQAVVVLFYMRTEPGSRVETLRWTSRFGTKLMAILAAPMLIGVLKEAARLIRFLGSGDQAERIEGV
jgi:hypothetical protein